MTLLRRSFPQYLQYARPYFPGGRKDAAQVFRHIVADQNVLARRVLEQLDALGCGPVKTEFPTDYTDAHDLAIDYLLERAIGYQRRDLETLEKLSSQLALNATARSLVDEARGMAQAHLESLEECRSGPADLAS